jgi:hypothetical protein
METRLVAIIRWADPGNSIEVLHVHKSHVQFLSAFPPRVADQRYTSVPRSASLRDTSRLTKIVGAKVVYSANAVCC